MLARSLPPSLMVRWGDRISCSPVRARALRTSVPVGRRPLTRRSLGVRSVSTSTTQFDPEASICAESPLHGSTPQHAAYSDAEWADDARVRLLAVPLAAAKAGGMPVVTYLAQSVEDPVVDPATQAGIRERLSMYANKIFNKTSEFWIGLGKPGVKSPGDWKRKTYVTGERLMDRIEYQEWSLKSINHVAGPHFAEILMRISSTPKVKKASVNAGHVPLLYPATGEAYDNASAFKIEPSVLLSSLLDLVKQRVPHHRRLLIWSVVAMPLTIPVAILPVIPNLPFFYLCWRAFSHWQAMRASTRILFLLENGLVVPTPSARMQYTFSTDPLELQAQQCEAKPAGEAAEKGKAPVTEKNKRPTAGELDKRLILQPAHIVQLERAFGLDHQSVVDLTRARTQTIGQLEQDVQSKGKADKKKVSIVHHMREMNDRAEQLKNE